MSVLMIVAIVLTAACAYCFLTAQPDPDDEDNNENLRVYENGRIASLKMFLEYERIMREYEYCQDRIQLDRIWKMVDDFRTKWNDNEWFIDLLLKDNEMQKKYVEV